MAPSEHPAQGLGAAGLNTIEAALARWDSIREHAADDIEAWTLNEFLAAVFAGWTVRVLLTTDTEAAAVLSHGTIWTSIPFDWRVDPDILDDNAAHDTEGWTDADFWFDHLKAFDSGVSDSINAVSPQALFSALIEEHALRGFTSPRHTLTIEAVILAAEREDRAGLRTLLAFTDVPAAGEYGVVVGPVAPLLPSASLSTPEENPPIPLV